MHSISYEERKMVVIILHRMRVANKCDIRRLTQPEPREETFNKGKMNYLCFYLISVTILFLFFYQRWFGRQRHQPTLCLSDLLEGKNDCL